MQWKFKKILHSLFGSELINVKRIYRWQIGYLSIIYSLFCAHEWRKIKRIRSPTRRFVTHRWNFCSSKKINVNQPTQLQLPVSNDFSPRFHDSTHCFFLCLFFFFSRYWKKYFTKYYPILSVLERGRKRPRKMIYLIKINKLLRGNFQP